MLGGVIQGQGHCSSLGLIWRVNKGRNGLAGNEDVHTHTRGGANVGERERGRRLGHTKLVSMKERREKKVSRSVQKTKKLKLI